VNRFTTFSAKTSTICMEQIAELAPPPVPETTRRHRAVAGSFPDELVFLHRDLHQVAITLGKLFVAPTAVEALERQP